MSQGRTRASIPSIDKPSKKQLGESQLSQQELAVLTVPLNICHINITEH